MLTLLQLNDSDTQAYCREDVVSVLETGEEEDWMPLNIFKILPPELEATA
jgi:hypothetical protein